MDSSLRPRNYNLQPPSALRPTPYALPPSSLRPKSFTLVELIISIAMFAYVLTVISGVFVSMQKADKRNYLDDYLVTESRFLLEKMVREVRKGTIDYEEYYYHKVKNKTNYGPSAAARTSDEGYGGYGKLFFDQGSDTLYGYCCDSTCSIKNCGNANLIVKSSLDQNTGINPAGDGTNFGTANAFSLIFTCSNSKYKTPANYQQSELYLISPDGKGKIMYKFVGNKLKILKLDGSDGNQNGISDKWTCNKDIEAVKGSACISPITDTEFRDITPTGIKITDINFIVSPLEDPYKAFFEDTFCDGVTIRHQPKVTIIMSTTIDPNTFGAGSLPAGMIPDVTIQTTISSMVYHDIPSYNSITGT